ncbi:MAG: Trm112 family protein [Candidatus Krumholzibacteriota bacterium]|nr:Trm112 family protein [Candidatus Krumholzibacteriota bacterium]
MIRKDLLDILACPQCREKVVLSGDNNWLVCNNCRLKYPVEDDIPIMLIDRAEKAE